MTDELTQYIQCDIEISTSGPSEKTVAAWTADALRRIADGIEAEGYEAGHHKVRDATGRPIGAIYLDYAEGLEPIRPDDE